ncbi:endonuclease/exonuclease/phosphatase family protein [Rhizobium lentis]|uniref:Endonuclease/exonuclease/phosphatase family metal-dependent hydrolase n=1 Tax=Rhizobium lentis TaxID=1138194 RepID=A0A7W8ULU2_9HYPH|nr:endonuclease/exonuclease/phosphatase family protein [Rhizobium lentis]MBB4573708.1 endonuclease/exonuclease/phosphatase family metal-dependent hydrolase [Rhizobium lentis]MBB5549636.1 endonuclease/exonuclease/phosphatase family metal-dependent hydrolase [Rhizobium lentis]MBB5560356.1 endonuclease/exonuclease/phosphatase family metal-dependent hydrolase [Rhizobium lentis]MBB5566756.1 endonuclease/exonuclease/phosphatase family metal-dependent hydrolase [Rhizobium lentis]
MSNNYAGMRRALAGQPKGTIERCAQRLLDIRKTLTPLRTQKKDSSLLLATWNIRDFDSNKFGFGPRLPETFSYIAEMIACFDLVAIQEVNRDLSALEKVMKILGREWDYIATDTTAGSGGNSERMAFVYNTEKVWFRKIAGEVVLPEGHLVVSSTKVKAPKGQPDVEPKTVEMEQQFARSRFLVAFQSGWFRFSLCTVHIYYGADSGEQLKRRIGEIQHLVEFFAARQDEASSQELDFSGAVENYILLGDFNVVSPEHETMKALKSHGFVVPAEIDGKKVRKLGDHFYDQIAVRVKDKRFKVMTGGLIDLYTDVFRSTDEDRALYAGFLPKSDPEGDPKFKAKTPEALYEKWRTWQMSDHAPLWLEIDTDFTESYLQTIAAGGPPGPKPS